MEPLDAMALPNDEKLAQIKKHEKVVQSYQSPLFLFVVSQASVFVSSWTASLAVHAALANACSQQAVSCIVLTCPLSSATQSRCVQRRNTVHQKRNKALAKKRSADEQKQHEAGYNNNKFNQYISDRIPLTRRSWDTRPIDCLKQTYTPHTQMPTVSVMIIFYNEARSTLLRTAWSVLNRSPPNLIKEILLVDDGSPMEHLHDKLTEEVANIPKTRVVRLGERVGLIRAKVLGVREATGDVVAFMDSHCEVNDGWLEPLLDRLVMNPKAVVCPVIDAIDADTFQIKEAIVEMGAFTWGLNFYWLSPPHTKHDKEVKTVVPFKSPAMAGGIFAMMRSYFIELGEYDEGMDTWGGENFEMSFRTWQCGGEIINVPCSHIAHVFRTESPYKFKNKKDPHATIAHNLNRVAEVWMDEYADIFYNTSVHSHKNYQTGTPDPHPGNMDSRVAVREKHKCKSFDWYMKEVATYMYAPLEKNFYHFGRLRNVFKGECLYHEGNPDGDMILAVFRDCDGPVDRPQEGAEAVSWYYTKGEGFEGQLRHEAEYGSRCLHAHHVKNKARLSLARCYDQEFDDERLRWDYDETTLQLRLHNKPTGCLSAHPDNNDQVIIAKCKDKADFDHSVTSVMRRQQWSFQPMPVIDERDEL